jgi:hypothetical protein
MADVQAKAAAAGLDWGKLVDYIQNLNWVELMMLIRQIIDIFRKKPPGPVVMGATDLSGCCKAHFEAITALAQCGADCCV